MKIITEGRDAPLYHSTLLQNAIKILRDGYINKSGKTDGISVSRDRELWFGDDEAGFGDVQFVLNQRKIAQRYKITPYDYFNNPESVYCDSNYRETGRGESEERIITNRLPIIPYVEKIIIRNDIVSQYDEIFDVKPYISKLNRIAKTNNIPVVFVKPNMTIKPDEIYTESSHITEAVDFKSLVGSLKQKVSQTGFLSAKQLKNSNIFRITVSSDVVSNLSNSLFSEHGWYLIGIEKNNDISIVTIEQMPTLETVYFPSYDGNEIPVTVSDFMVGRTPAAAKMIALMYLKNKTWSDVKSVSIYKMNVDKTYNIKPHNDYQNCLLINGTLSENNISKEKTEMEL